MKNISLEALTFITITTFRTFFFHNVYTNGVNLGQTRKRWNSATNDNTPQYLRIQLRHLVTATIRFVFYPVLMTIY